jgi:DNA repair protein RadC
MDRPTEPTSQSEGMAAQTRKRRQASRGYDCRVVARLPRVREATGPSLRTGDEVATLCKDLADLAQESFHVLTLDQKHRVIVRHLVSLGSLTESLVHPREVYRAALLDSAAAVVFVHNHPSGDPKPSRDDIEITARLVEAGRLLGIRVLDHVIIGRGAHFSFAESGML